jgi:hypothetical protein
MWRHETLIRKKAMNIPCVIHAENAEWFLVQEISDFHFDGFALNSKCSVERRRYNQFDKTLEKVLRTGGVMPSKSPLSVEGNSQEVFKRLSEIEVLVTVEAVDESRFLIGTIHRITSERLFMKHFPANGKWFARPTGIDFSEIGRVCFGDEYGNGWQRFFKRHGVRPRHQRAQRLNKPAC